MKSGVVAQKDVMDFSQSIYDEAPAADPYGRGYHPALGAGRDELHRETGPIDLYDFCRREVERMRPEADRRGVTLSLQGEAATVQGNAQILGELVYNLLDNAIKYNKPQGSVTVTVTPGKRVRLRVGGYGHRHSEGEPEPGLRAVLPGGQEPFRRRLRHGPGPVDRKARGPVPPGPGGTPEHRGQGHGITVTFPLEA